MSRFRIGEVVAYQNTYYTVVGFDGNALNLQPMHSRQIITVPMDLVSKHLSENSRFEDNLPLNS